jgi:hypothetical protein
LIHSTIEKPTAQFAIYITHDIDWLNPLHPYSVLNSIRSLIGKHKWFSLKRLFDQELFLNNIEQLLQLEKALGIQAIYCIGASAGSTFGRHSLRYQPGSALYSNLMQLLHQYDMLVGLHSSYNGIQKGTLQQEQNRLSTYWGKKSNFHRAHYIPHLSSDDYTELESAGFTYDLGFGSSSSIGLRHKPQHNFKPVESHSIGVIPMILMDNVFFKRPYHEVITAFKSCLQTLKTNNGSACIAFHPENMLLRPQLYSYFEEIIHLCKQEGAILNPKPSAL